ncbi:MAG: hypothetical protein ACOYOB_20090 [Myxococcota bacterium]
MAITIKGGNEIEEPDYTLKAENGNSVWIEVGGLSLYVSPSPHAEPGVLLVRLFRHFAEMGAPLWEMRADMHMPEAIGAAPIMREIAQRVHTQNGGDDNYSNDDEHADALVLAEWALKVLI